MFKNLFLTSIIFLLSGVVFYLVVQNVDPLGAQKLMAIFIFFLSLFCGVASFFTFIFFFGEEIIVGRKLGSPAFLRGIRRGILISTFITVLLLLQLFRLLGILEVILLATFLALVEFIFLSSK